MDAPLKLANLCGCVFSDCDEADEVSKGRGEKGEGDFDEEEGEKEEKEMADREEVL